MEKIRRGYVGEKFFPQIFTLSRTISQFEYQRDWAEYKENGKWVPDTAARKLADEKLKRIYSQINDYYFRPNCKEFVSFELDSSHLGVKVANWFSKHPTLSAIIDVAESAVLVSTPLTGLAALIYYVKELG